MHEHMNALWSMGGSEWLLLALFWTLSIVVSVLLILSWRRMPRDEVSAKVSFPLVRMISQWRAVPEVQLAMIGLPLSLLREIAQFPLYSVWHQNDRLW